MKRKALSALCILFMFSFLYGGEGNRHTTAWTTGIYTTLSGYGAWQSNHSLVRNPANGNLHVVLSASEDSAGTVRRTMYAFSSNGGITWNNFNNVRVPSRRSGFPMLDLLQGPTEGGPVIANESDAGLGNQTIVYADYPEGGGAFSELNAPPGMGGSDEPIWPFVACAPDGSIIVLATRSTAQTVHTTRTDDFATWSPWITFAGAAKALGLAANSTGKVAALTLAANRALQLWVSSDNGRSWPAIPRIIVPSPLVIEGDTFFINGSCDLVYRNESPCVVFPISKVINDSVFTRSSIGYWSDATGVKFAVRWDAPYGVVPTINRCDGLRIPLGEPSIGLSGSNLIVAFQAVASTSLLAECRDIFLATSIDSGAHWGRPVNETNTYSLDEYSPSVPQWTYPYVFQMVWLERSNPCGNELVRQVFFHSLIQEVQSHPMPVEFRLDQNYPNPFNPSTRITYAIESGNRGGGEPVNVMLKVFDVLGRDVATLVNERKSPGEYSVVFDAANHPTGVYFYRLQAGSFSQTRKLLLVR